MDQSLIHIIILLLVLGQAIGIYLLANRCSKELLRYSVKIDGLDRKIWNLAAENYRLKQEVRQHIRNQPQASWTKSS